jgi:hypothetical protein
MERATVDAQLFYYSTCSCNLSSVTARVRVSLAHQTLARDSYTVRSLRYVPNAGEHRSTHVKAWFWVRPRVALTFLDTRHTASQFCTLSESQTLTANPALVRAPTRLLSAAGQAESPAETVVG